MKLSFKTIISLCVALFIVMMLSLIPIRGNYRVNNINLEDSTMNITYSSLIPFINIDTIVHVPGYYYATIVENHKYDDPTSDDGFSYVTITQVGKYEYVYHSKKAYDYVDQYEVDGKLKLIEKFWPYHYMQTIGGK